MVVKNIGISFYLTHNLSYFKILLTETTVTNEITPMT